MIRVRKKITGGLIRQGIQQVASLVIQPRGNHSISHPCRDQVLFTRGEFNHGLRVSRTSKKRDRVHDQLALPEIQGRHGLPVERVERTQTPETIIRRFTTPHWIHRPRMIQINCLDPSILHPSFHDNPASLFRKPVHFLYSPLGYISQTSSNNPFIFNSIQVIFLYAMIRTSQRKTP